MSIKASKVAEYAAKSALGKPHFDYAVKDCQGWVEWCWSQAGYKKNYSGSNDMWRNACSWTGTVAEAKAQGKMVAGAMVFKIDFTGSSKYAPLPPKYNSTKDKGNAYHVGIYCNGIDGVEVGHSSTGGSQAGKLSAGWTHVGWTKGLEYEAPPQEPPIDGPLDNESLVAKVSASSVNMRETPGGKYMLKVPYGTVLYITAIQAALDTRYGKITYNKYTGWVDMKFVDETNEGIAIDPPIVKPGEIVITNDYKVWEYLKGVGLSDNAAAGIMGNIYAESGFKPNNLQNSHNTKLGMTDEAYTLQVDNGAYTKFVTDGAGYGICQWTHSSRKSKLLDFTKALGVSIGNLNMQLNFMWQELQGYKSVIGVVTNPSVTLQDASNAFMIGYERPADQSATNKVKRAGYGRVYYNKYKGRGDSNVNG